MGIRTMENRVRRGMTVGGFRVLIVAKQSFVEQNGAHFWHISSKTSWLAGIGLNLFVTDKIQNPDDPKIFGFFIMYGATDNSYTL